MTGEAPAQEVVFSEDLRGQVGRALAGQNARRVLLVTTPSRRGIHGVLGGLSGVLSEVFDGAMVHVPLEVVTRASAVVDRFAPDTILTLGGGAATGLGKALRLEHELRFIAVPTTYSASERTSVYGIKTGTDKETGRDPRVRPDVVIYAPRITLDMPGKLTVQSLANALAHPVSALSTGALDDDARRDALEAIRQTTLALRQLRQLPRSVDARLLAFEAASMAGDVIERGHLGVQHRIAHFLGGRFDLPHAAVHSILLPHTLASLRTHERATYEAIADASGLEGLPGALQDLLRDAGAETALTELGVEEAPLDEATQQRPELPVALIRDALFGARPPD